MKRNFNVILNVLLILLVCLSLYIFISRIIYNINREKKVETYFTESENIDTIHYSDITSVLEIPSIKLKQGLVDITSKDNDVNKNIEILKASKMPNIEGSTLYLAGHSGNSKIAFFNNIDKLNIGDTIYYYYDNTKYTYKIYDIYTEIKDGSISVKKENFQRIVLTTCSKTKGYQLVIIAKLTNKEPLKKGGDA